MPNPNPPTATLRAFTASGTVFEIDEPGKWLRRIPAAADANTAFDQVALRRDGEWIRFAFMGRVRLGHPLTFILVPLGDPNRVAATARASTPVTRLERPTVDA